VLSLIMPSMPLTLPQTAMTTAGEASAGGADIAFDVGDPWAQQNP